jgi:hypothetical protein
MGREGAEAFRNTYVRSGTLENLITAARQLILFYSKD